MTRNEYSFVGSVPEIERVIAENRRLLKESVRRRSQLLAKPVVEDLSKFADGTVIRWDEREKSYVAIKQGDRWAVTAVGTDGWNGFDPESWNLRNTLQNLDGVTNVELLSSHRIIKRAPGTRSEKVK